VAQESKKKQKQRTLREVMLNAYKSDAVIPAFNIPYLPMIRPVTEALFDMNCFGLITVALLEFRRFEAGNHKAVFQEYRQWCRPEWMRLHQDHVPVIDEDGNRVEYMEVLRQAVETGFDSIMIDGSRLGLEDNIAATKKAVIMAGKRNIPVEAELGAVMGHEAGPLPAYEELFRTAKGFTSVAEAERFVKETKVDWLSVAFGSIHGSIRGKARDAKKVRARLNIEHLQKLRDATGIPMVLHGGSGIEKRCLTEAFENGIAKINIATDIRQPYENAIREGKSISQARKVVYDHTCRIIAETLEMKDSKELVNPE